MRLSDEQFKRLFPSLSSAKRRVYRPLLLAAMEEFGITTRLRASAFLAQVGHESLDLTRLREIWGPTPAQARYDTRADLGNTPERDGDGRKYLGRGGIGRTGKKNYQRAEVALGLPLLAYPQLLELPENAFRSDGLFWKDNDLNALADKLSLKADVRDLERFDKITKRINGGYNGRIDRQRRYLEAIQTLRDEDFAVPPVAALGEAQTSAPASPASNQDLFDEFSASGSTSSVAKKIALKLGRPLALLWAALEAGNFYAWLGLGILVVGLAGLIYLERKPIASGARWVWQKVRSKL